MIKNNTSLRALAKHPKGCRRFSGESHSTKRLPRRSAPRNDIRFELEEYHRNIPARELTADIKRTARKLRKKRLSVTDYKEHGKYSPTTIWHRFGTWNKAVKTAGLLPTHTRKATARELFDNLEEMWIKKGSQPTSQDMKLPFSKLSVTPYQNMFGSWRGALKAFVEYINGGRVIGSLKNQTHSSSVRAKKRSRRNVTKRLRYLVIERDNYKCRACGRSPATERGVKLQIDHIIPWSKGGDTVIDNLQTLCSECNAGKGNLI
jgi:hypothetical protein